MQNRLNINLNGTFLPQFHIGRSKPFMLEGEFDSTLLMKLSDFRSPNVPLVFFTMLAVLVQFDEHLCSLTTFAAHSMM